MTDIAETVDYSALDILSEKEKVIVTQMTTDRENGATRWVENNTTRKVLRTTGQVATGGLLVFGAWALYNHYSE